MRSRKIIKGALIAHLAAGGTINDSTTDDLYREWHRTPAEDDTDLETVEQWAVDTGCTPDRPA